jgi:hypothetical protein
MCFLSYLRLTFTSLGFCLFLCLFLCFLLTFITVPFGLASFAYICLYIVTPIKIALPALTRTSLTGCLLVLELSNARKGASRCMNPANIAFSHSVEQVARQSTFLRRGK